MLDEKDLQAIARLMDEKIGASESRIMEHMKEETGASEVRMSKMVDEKIGASEVRMSKMMDEKAGASESRMMAMMEAYFEPKFDLLAEQIQLIMEKLTPAEALEDVEDRVDVLEAVVRRHSQEITELKRAQ